MNVTWLDWFGYAASVVILISLTMSSIIKLRWVNLAGAVMFAVFGYLIGSIPTGTLNAGIAFIDIYFLIRLYRERDELAIVRAETGSAYFVHVWKTNETDIENFGGVMSFAPETEAFYFLRNNNTAGLLVGRLTDEHTFRVLVDYVTPPFRDFKVGVYTFVKGHLRDVLPDVERIEAFGGNPQHARYLERLGFEETGSDDIYVRAM